MRRFLNPKFYIKWLKDFYHLYLFMPFKWEFFNLPFARLGLSKSKISFSESHKPLTFPKDRILDAVCVFTEIFSNEDYKLDEEIVNTTIIDCGANFGYATTYFMYKHPQNKFIAVEPDSSNVDVIKNNLQRVFSEKSVEIIQKAISYNNKGVKVVDSTLPPSLLQFLPGEKGENTIPSLSLNQIVDGYNINSIGILKIDIEGAEKNIFEHESSIDKTLMISKYLIIETHDEYQPGTAQLIESTINRYGFKRFQKKDHEYVKTSIVKYKKVE